MYVAGDPSLGLVALTCLGGYLSGGRRRAVNHYYDRDIDARMARTATRPIPAGRGAPQAALAFGIGLAAASFVELTLSVNLLAACLALSGFFGYVLVYTVWPSADAAEHRHRRRGGRGAAARRLGRRHRPGLDRPVPVRDRVLLDAATSGRSRC